MKKIINITFLLVTIMLFLGCSKQPISQRSMVGGDNQKFVKNDKIPIVNDGIIAYAYFDEDKKLIDIKDTYKYFSRDKNIEVVNITKSGFYPQLYFTGEISCIKRDWGSDYANRECYSIFSKINIADAVIRNSIIAVGTLGFGTLYGGKATIKNFDYETFYKVIEENGLIEKRKELISKLNKK